MNSVGFITPSVYINTITPAGAVPYKVSVVLKTSTMTGVNDVRWYLTTGSPTELASPPNTTWETGSTEPWLLTPGGSLSLIISQSGAIPQTFTGITWDYSMTYRVS